MLRNTPPQRDPELKMPTLPLSARLAKAQVLQQTGTAMLAQANARSSWFCLSIGATDGFSRFIEVPLTSRWSRPPDFHKHQSGETSKFQVSQPSLNTIARPFFSLTVFSVPLSADGSTYLGSTLSGQGYPLGRKVLPLCRFFSKDCRFSPTTCLYAAITCNFGTKPAICDH